LPKLDEKITVDKWLTAWERVYERDGSVRIEIVGGEPLIYPGIAELLQGLTKKHYVSIVTNLSCSLEKLINLTNGISSEKLNMALSFHPSFAKLESFLNKAVFLKEKCISNAVLYVTYPPQFKLMAYFKREFEEKGLQFIPVPFRGKHNGIDYPAAYTEEEKSIISSLSGGLHKEQKSWVENQLAPQKTKGKLCRAGQVYSYIDLYGAVYRCSDSSLLLGNFFEDFSLLEKPLPCAEEICPCDFKWLVN
jgi:MoaA/NifB/PqqE/SkfB family radical SAM enzyme